MKQRRCTARAIIIRDGKLLVFERWRQNTSDKILHYFSIPGGGIEDSETPEQAVVRELMEEMGIIISVGELLVRQMTDTRYHYYYKCSIISGTPVFQTTSPEASNASSNNRYEAAWIDPSEFKSLPFFPAYQQAVEVIMTTYNSMSVQPTVDISF